MQCVFTARANTPNVNLLIYIPIDNRDQKMSYLYIKYIKHIYYSIIVIRVNTII